MAIPVSDNWKNDIEQRFRNQGYLNFSIEVVAPGLREGTSVLSSDTHPVTEVNTLRDGIVEDIPIVATCEHNRWKLDGKAKILDSNNTVQDTKCWWDNKLIHNDTQFTVLTFSFDQPYKVPGIYCIWDTERDSWPTKLRIEGFNVEGSSLGVYNITNISSSRFLMEVSFDNVTKIVFHILGWSNPNWRARCSEVVFGIHSSFDTDRILSATTTSKISVTAEELPQYSATISVGNYDGMFDPLLVEGHSKYITVKQKADCQWGFKLLDKTIEQAPKQPMFITDVSLPSNSSSLDLTLGSRIDFLTDPYKKDTFSGAKRSFEKLAKDILRDADLIKQKDVEVPFILDPILETLYTTAPLPKLAYNVLLQYIASATGTVLTIDPNTGFINIKSLGISRDHRVISRSQELADPSITVIEEVHSITINVYQYTSEPNRSEIYKGSFVLENDTTLFIDYPLSKDAEAAITGGSIISATYYTEGADVVVRPTISTAPVEITITGFKITKASTAFETYRNTNIARGLDIVIDNPLITEVEQLSPLTNYLYNYYSKRQEVVVNYTGYPEMLAGDAITSTSKYGTVEGDLLENTITFNPGWKGTAVIRANKISE